MILTEDDVQNLDFLRSLSDDGLLNWYSQASEDDIAYAQELLDAWENELMFMEAEERGVIMVQGSNTLQ